MPLACSVSPSLYLSISLALSLTHSSTHSRFSTHLLMCFSAWIHSPLQFTFLSPLSKHSLFQAYTHQVSLNEFFINWSHFLSFFPYARKCFHLRAKDRLMSPCLIWTRMMCCLVDFEKLVCLGQFGKSAYMTMCQKQTNWPRTNTEIYRACPMILAIRLTFTFTETQSYSETLQW